MSLRAKALSGLFWSFIDSFFVKGISFITLMFLARWLGPKDFGIFSLMALFIGVGTTLVDSGLSSSIIRTKDTDNVDYSTVLLINITIAFLVYVGLFFLAPSIAKFFSQDILCNLIRVYCLTFITSAFSAVQLAILTKNMRFRRIMILNIPGTLVGIVIGLSMAYKDYGVWSMVGMYLSTQIIFSLLLWSSTSWAPSLRFSLEKAKYHLNFGYKLVLASLLNLIFDNSYNILIGKFYPVQILGYFDRAKQLTDFPSMALTSVVGKVTYPMLSQLQGDRVRISEVYKKILRSTFFTIAPFMIGAAAIAYPLFDLVLGEEWILAVPFFQILSIPAILYPIHAFHINILKVYGRTDLFLKLEIVKKIIILVSLFVGFQFGILGMVWSIVLNSIFCLLINSHYTSQFINYKKKHQILDLFPILMIGIIMFLTVTQSLHFFSHYTSFIKVTLSALVGAFVYITMSLLLPKSPIYELFETIKPPKI
ncbi:lipopolysaccharide biosynthesis protein [Akkermansiaceae bacterium]|nr:lipopolysaccharide biosynthesis protein [Akkermansiaceae bacterium]